MIKTKHRIIVDELGETLNALEFNVCVDDSPSLQEKWIKLESLKKEIEQEKLVKSPQDIYLNENFYEGYNQAINDILELLNDLS